MLYRLLIVLTALIITNCGNKTDPADLIVFSSSRNGNSDIYTMKIDGSELRALTTDSSEQWSPSWLSESEITFLYQKEDSIGRRAIDLNSLESRELSHPPNCLLTDKNMLYAAKGTKGLYSCLGDIFVLQEGVDGILNISQNMLGQSRYPSWADGGDAVVFTNNQTGSNDIYLFDLPSQTLKRLISYPSNEERPSLSSDGRYLAFSSDMEEAGNQEIMIMEMKTERLMNVSKSNGTELIARWAEKDPVLYYGSDKEGNWEIYSFDLPSRHTERLTNDPAFDGDPQLYRY